MVREKHRKISRVCLNKECLTVCNKYFFCMYTALKVNKLYYLVLKLKKPALAGENNTFDNTLLLHSKQCQHLSYF